MKDLLLKVWVSRHNVIRRIAPDSGTAFLGIAALFFVRGFPATASLDFDSWFVAVSLFFFIAGLFLRAVGNE